MIDDPTALAVVVGGVSGLSSAVAGAVTLVRIVLRPAITELRAELSARIDSTQGRIDAAEGAITAADREARNGQKYRADNRDRIQALDTWRAGADVRLDGIGSSIERTAALLDRLRDRDPRGS